MAGKDPEDAFIDMIKDILRNISMDLALLEILLGFLLPDEKEIKLIKNLLNKIRLHRLQTTMDPSRRSIARGTRLDSLEDDDTMPNTAFKLDGDVEDSTGENNYLIDVIDEGDKVTVITEVPSVEDVSVEVVGNNRLVIKTPHGAREVELSSKVYGEPVKVGCRNGICEVVLKKILP